MKKLTILIGMSMMLFGNAYADDGAGGRGDEYYRKAAYLMSWNGGMLGEYTPILEIVALDLSIAILQDSYDDFETCKGEECTRDSVMGGIKSLSEEHATVDIYTSTHGNTHIISTQDKYKPITDKTLACSRTGWERRHRLRAAVQMNCYGASMNDDWLKLGFEVSSGSKKIDAVMLHIPMFMELWRERECVPGLGGNCSRTYGESLVIAFAMWRWLQEPAAAVLFNANLLELAPEIDSTPEMIGNLFLNITTQNGTYNACNGHGDAYGFLMPDDTCCLPGQTCDKCMKLSEVLNEAVNDQQICISEVPEDRQPCHPDLDDQKESFNCAGADAFVEESINPDSCPTGRPAPANQCVTGKSCILTGVCVFSQNGNFCAVPCENDSDCNDSEKYCAVLTNVDGNDKGKSCVEKMSVEDKACICKGLLLGGCSSGGAGGGTGSSSGSDVYQKSQEGTIEHEYNSDKTMAISSPAEPINWTAACGCKVTADSAMEMCGYEFPPDADSGCSTVGGNSGIALTGLLAFCLLFRRRR
jgi:uncharacterized protein (TIGR03382 family)